MENEDDMRKISETYVIAEGILKDRTGGYKLPIVTYELGENYIDLEGIFTVEELEFFVEVMRGRLDRVPDK